MDYNDHYLYLLAAYFLSIRILQTVLHLAADVTQKIKVILITTIKEFYTNELFCC